VGKGKIKTWKQKQIMYSNSDNIMIDMMCEHNNKLVSRCIGTKEELHFKIESVFGSSLK
jgi:hypothetical protein